MQLGAASYGAGDSYLLPAFAAVFLGATQIRPGRFNIGGTVVALYLLAIGVQGLQLRFPELPWIKNALPGFVLIVAVALGRGAAHRRAAKGNDLRQTSARPGYFGPNRMAPSTRIGLAVDVAVADQLQHERGVLRRLAHAGRETEPGAPRARRAPRRSSCTPAVVTSRAIELTRMPTTARSLAATRVSPRMPPFAAEYAAWPMVPS